MKRIILIIAAMAALAACRESGWTKQEMATIMDQGMVMYVTTVPGDSTILRTKCTEIGPKELKSEELQTLIAKMKATVTDPSQDGVGIAAPQVGISRRIIVVQRFDKEGEPFEAYVNVKIDSLKGEIVRGREGCLSIPGLRGIVPRNSIINISYTEVPSGTTIKEQIEGFTAVIFQHECDHLDGILYTDRADSLFTY